MMASCERQKATAGAEGINNEPGMREPGDFPEKIQTDDERDVGRVSSLFLTRTWFEAAKPMMNSEATRTIESEMAARRWWWWWWCRGG